MNCHVCLIGSVAMLSKNEQQDLDDLEEIRNNLEGHQYRYSVTRPAIYGDIDGEWLLDWIIKLVDKIE